MAFCRQSRKGAAVAHHESSVVIHEQSVQIPIDGITLQGDLAVPRPLSGIVVFAHGSGSSRHSPRNRYVARVLQENGLATLLLDLLTPLEEREDAVTRLLRFNIRAPRGATRSGDGLGPSAASRREASGRLFRRKHGCGCRTEGRCRATRHGSSGRVSRRTSRPGFYGTLARASANPTDRRRG